MENRETTMIVGRFFFALEKLKQEHVIRGVKTFTDRYGINRWNMMTTKSKPDSGMFQLGWLTYLVRDYSVSPTWLLTGCGEWRLMGGLEVSSKSVKK